jgi:hypothetical protein
MGSWWITFSDRGPACAGFVTKEEAGALADAAGRVVSMEVLPYPASPRLDDNEGWGEGQCPSFCYTPDKCKGRGSCPNNPCCTD